MPPVYIVQNVFLFFLYPVSLSYLFSILIRRTRAIPCSSAVHEPHGAAVSRGRGSPALRAYPLPATLLPTVQPIPPQAHPPASPSPWHPNLARMHALFRRSCMATRPVPRRGCRRCTRRAARRSGAAPASLSLRQQEPLPAHPSPLACSLSPVLHGNAPGAAPRMPPVYAARSVPRWCRSR